MNFIRALNYHNVSNRFWQVFAILLSVTVYIQGKFPSRKELSIATKYIYFKMVEPDQSCSNIISELDMNIRIACKLIAKHREVGICGM